MQSITLPAGHAIEKASESDSKWFERHPHRSYRVRRSIRGEFLETKTDNPEGYTLWTLVKQIEPGFRFRTRLFVKRGAEPIDADWTIAPLFECVLACMKAGDFRAVGPDSDLGEAVINAFLPPAHVLRADTEGGVQ